MMSMGWARGFGAGLIAWCAGVAGQLQQQALWPFAAYAGLLALAWSGLHWSRWTLPSWGRTLVLCLGWFVLSFSITGVHALSRSVTLAPSLEGQDLDVVGVVKAMPQRQDVGWRFRFGVEQAWQVDKTGAKHAVHLSDALPSQVYLGWYGQEGTHDSGWTTSPLPEPVKAGERWRLRVRLKAPHGNMNPRGFDYELWLWEQGIGATGYVRTGAKDPAPERLANTWAHPIEAWRQSVRDRLLTHVFGLANDPKMAPLAGILAALVTGDQAAIDRSDWDVFRATGVAHLMSISGLHVTMFAWLASGLMAWAWRKSALWGFSGALRWPASHVGALSGLALAGLYALFSGWGLPAQRTLLMLLTVALLKMSSRQWSGFLIWWFAGAAVLTWDPWALLQPGFWLSFVAVGVLMASDPSSRSRPFSAPVRVVDGAPAWRTPAPSSPFWHRMGAPAGLGAAAGLLREQATVTLSLAPLTLLFFGQVSVVGLLANLLAIPWVTLVVTPLALLGVLWSDAWLLAVWALQPMTAGLAWLADWPWASVSGAAAPWGFAAMALAGAVAMVLELPLSWKLLCLPLLWPALFWANPRPAPGTFEVLAPDVGQGNAVLVRTAGHSLMYDAGPRYSAESDAGHRVLVPLLTQMGERIDVLMLSHRDSDHTGGAPAVLAMQTQASLWTSMEETHALHGMRPGWTRCQAGQSWVWDGVRFEVLHPPASAPQVEDQNRKANELSCVLRISSPQGSALLTGDIEAGQELALVRWGLLPVDWLLVPHHGSKTSSTAPFLQALKPRIAMVQAGYRNRFGHPAPAVVARYADMQIQLIDSVHCGAATWRSDAPAQVVCERHRSRRYWHHLPP